MRFIDFNSTLQRGRRFVNGLVNFYDDQLTDTKKLGEVLRAITIKLADIEGKTQPEAVEFEKNVGNAGAVVTFEHGFDCPVRWYVVDWHGSPVPTAGHSFVRDATNSTSKRLALKSYTTGKVVLRIEPSQYGLST